MTISRLEIENFLIFSGKFAMDFCPNINVLVGGNSTGKTTLLKLIYAFCNISSSTIANGSSLEINQPSIIKSYFMHTRGHTDPSNCSGRLTIYGGSENVKLSIGVDSNLVSESVHLPSDVEQLRQWVYGNFISVFIPEKDMLSNSRGLPETFEYGNAQFTRTEIDIIKKARILANGPEQPLYTKICKIINAEPENDGQSFYMRHKDLEDRIPFSLEASGYRKFGLLAALIRNEQIRSGSILLWDEPENSLNPELVPCLVDILLELSHNGVQIFVATHSEILARYFAVNRRKSDDVTFHSLYKDGKQIKTNENNRFDLLASNNLMTEPVKLYEKEIEYGLNGNG
ncbi:MAG: AAA family ATPase [Holosporaceae bacterium]|jgi:AAA15 family ATPase/GTPase|nr:AAA family ATPase [Holosporaceae bacterium]